MSRIVQEWVEKAEGDFLTANRELRADPNPNYDAACYHAQQCVEKLMKALLIKFGVTPPRTHHLVILDELLHETDVEWSYPLEKLRVLSLAAVQFRYPGDSATQDDAEFVLGICEEIRAQLLNLLSIQY